MEAKRFVIGLICLLLLGAVAGCGTGGGGGGSRQPGPTEETTAAGGQVIKTIEVKETEYKLKPAEIRLDKPGTYVFEAVNDGNVTHALEIEGKGIEEETENLSSGQRAKLKVSLKAGTYEIYCPVDGHRGLGMVGTVTVGGASGGGGTTSGDGGSGGYGY